MLVGADTELLRAIELVYHALTGKLQLIVFFPLFFFENQIVLEFEKYHLRRALSQQDVVLHVHHQLAQVTVDNVLKFISLQVTQMDPQTLTLSVKKHNLVRVFVKKSTQRKIFSGAVQIQHYCRVRHFFSADNYLLLDIIDEMMMLLVWRIKKAYKNPSIRHKGTRYKWILKVINGHRPVKQTKPLIDLQLILHYLLLCPLLLAKSSEPIVAILLIGYCIVIAL